MRLMGYRVLLVVIMTYLVGYIAGSLPIVAWFQENPGYWFPAVAVMSVCPILLGILTMKATVADATFLVVKAKKGNE